MTPNIRALYSFSFFNGFRPHWPISIIYFKEITGSYTLAMTIYSVVFFSQALLEVPAGIFSDGFQRRRAMIIGALCASLSILCYAIGISFWILVVGALLEGLSRALFSGTDSALLFESVREEERDSKLHHFLGKMNSMSQIALCLSAALCTWLSLYSLKLVVWISVIPQLLSLVSAISLTNVNSREKDGEHFIVMLKEAFRNFKENTKLKLLAIADTIDFGIGEAIFYFQSAFFDTLIPTWMLGITRCLNHLNGFIGFWFAGNIVRHFGARHTLIFGTILSSGIKFLSVVFASALSPFISAAINIVYGPTTTARGVLLQKEFSDRQRATMGSMISLTGSILFACVSTLLGLLADVTSPGTAIMIAVLGNSVIVFIYAKVFKDNSRQSFN